VPISPPGSRWAERNSFPLIVDLPKQNHQKSSRATQSKNRRQDEPELRQIAVNITNYNQIKPPFFLISDIFPTKVRKKAHFYSTITPEKLLMLK
jgi:hypothetical protein